MRLLAPFHASRSVPTPISGSTASRLPSSSERTTYRVRSRLSTVAKRNCSAAGSKLAVAVEVDPEAVLRVGHQAVAVAVDAARGHAPGFAGILASPSATVPSR